MDLILETSFAQYLTRQAKEQGFEQGIDPVFYESILAVLEVRFNLTASYPLAVRIAEIDDEQRVRQLHRAAFQFTQPRGIRSVVGSGTGLNFVSGIPAGGNDTTGTCTHSVRRAA